MRKRRLSLIVICILTGLAVLYLSRPRTQNLLEGSRAVADAGAFQSPFGTPNSFVYYFWLSEREILYLDTTPPHSRLMRQDIRTRVQTEVDTSGLPDAPTSLNRIANALLSPNRKNLLLRLSSNGSIPDRIVAIPILASNAKPGPATVQKLFPTWTTNHQFVNHMFWLSDSQHWLILNSLQPKSTLRDLVMDLSTAPAVAETSCLSSIGSFYSMMPMNDGSIIAVSVRKTLQLNGLMHCTVRVAKSFPLLKTPSRISRDLPLPDPAAVDANLIAVSPDGKRLLWTVTCEEDTIRRLAVTVHQAFPNLPLPKLNPVDRLGQYLYVSDQNGESFRLVARLGKGWSIYANKMSTSDLPPFQNIQWTPDSKHISFLYQKHLYVRPLP